MVIEVLGWVGAVVILAGYALFSLGRLRDGLAYQGVNLVGSTLIAVNVASHGAVASAVVNTIWASIAIAVIARTLLVRRAAARRAAAPTPLPLTTVAPSVLASAVAPVSGAASPAVEPAPTTAPVPLADSVAVITGAIAIIALAASQQHADAQAADAATAGAHEATTAS